MTKSTHIEIFDFREKLKRLYLGATHPLGLVNHKKLAAVLKIQWQTFQFYLENERLPKNIILKIAKIFKVRPDWFYLNQPNSPQPLPVKNIKSTPDILSGWYFPRLVYKSDKNNKLHDKHYYHEKDIIKIFSGTAQKKIVLLLGEAGVGKTTYLENIIASVTPKKYPYTIRLRHVTCSLSNHLKSDKNIHASPKIFYLDGWDELDPQLEPIWRNEIYRTGALFFITCRTDCDTKLLADQTFHISDLKPSETKSYISCLIQNIEKEKPYASRLTTEMKNLLTEALLLHLIRCPIFNKPLLISLQVHYLMINATSDINEILCQLKNKSSVYEKIIVAFFLNKFNFAGKYFRKLIDCLADMAMSIHGRQQFGRDNLYHIFDREKYNFDISQHVLLFELLLRSGLIRRQNHTGGKIYEFFHPTVMEWLFARGLLQHNSLYDLVKENWHQKNLQGMLGFAWAIAREPDRKRAIQYLLQQDSDKNIRGLKRVLNYWYSSGLTMPLSESKSLVRKIINVEQKISIAYDNTTPREILLELCTDKNLYVRQGVASNRNADNDILEYLSVDAEKNVRASVASHPNIRPNLLLRLSSDNNKFVRRRVAFNPNTTTPILKQLAKDNDRFVRVGVAIHLNTPIEIANRLRSEYEGWQNLPESLYELSKLINNPNHSIRLSRILNQQKKLFKA